MSQNRKLLSEAFEKKTTERAYTKHQKQNLNNRAEIDFVTK